MISTKLLLKCYEAALMPRWGEYARPVELDELGRQGQMLQTAFVIAECRRHAGVEISWERLIELTFIRFFRRLALTDIQAPVFARLYAERRSELDAYVLSEMGELVESLPGSFPTRFTTYLSAAGPSQDYRAEREALNAAAALVTHWELDQISPLNTGSLWLPETRRNVEALAERSAASQVNGEVRALLQDRTFLEATGRLRIQRRWSRLATIPEFNVAGHSFMVALLVWACCQSISESEETHAGEDWSEQRIANGVFGAVFHDIGEALTRDVINPVKRGGGIEHILRETELDSLAYRLWPHIPECAREPLWQFAEYEFEDGKQIGGAHHDGSLVKLCDKIAAAAEIRITIENGVASSQMREILVGLGSSAVPERCAALLADLVSED